MRWKIIRRERPDSSVYPYPRPDRTTLGPGEIEATGTDELAGYMELWARSLFFSVAVDYENDGRGNMWPIGKDGPTLYSLVFDGGADEIYVDHEVTTALMLFRFWIFGKREVSYPGLTTARALDNPKRDRLELLARTYMTDRDVKQTVADLSKTVEYMSVIQAADDA